ncbi:VrrA/YqfQ family protein [Bacillus sp. FJAT-27231]|uniref:VrrA/YqfQ family protein n=1 Tax=Bacillus sp. FJAT-27231 TaxID=1679168 RepID=UPI0006707D78|nr:VrrA/YqfQ family protein [Bacillus sp. FJAT-27231]
MGLTGRGLLGRLRQGAGIGPGLTGFERQGVGAVAQKAANPINLQQMLANTQQVLKTVQQFGPIVQQYGPMVKNLPSMWRLYKGLKSLPNADEEQKDDNQAEETEQKKKKQPADTPKTEPKRPTSKVKAETEAPEETDNISSQELKPKSSRPKLYI